MEVLRNSLISYCANHNVVITMEIIWRMYIHMCRAYLIIWISVDNSYASRPLLRLSKSNPFWYHFIIFLVKYRAYVGKVHHTYVSLTQSEVYLPVYLTRRQCWLSDRPSQKKSVLFVGEARFPLQFCKHEWDHLITRPSLSSHQLSEEWEIISLKYFYISNKF